MRPEIIAPGVARLRIGYVNAYSIAGPQSGWALIDSGTPGHTAAIREATASLYGGARPFAIFLTHGHVDHAGCARALAEDWNVPIYAHRLERPFLTSKSPYPPPDPTVGGCVGLLSRFLPSEPPDLGGHLYDLPPGGELPGLPDWRWHHTPGHTPGHVALFHERRLILLAGDAVTSVDMDSCLALATRWRRVSRPPAPFTCDWPQAASSVEALAALRPFYLGCGHGEPMSGDGVARGLSVLAARFPIPERGRYSKEAARCGLNGIVHLPPPVADPLPKLAASVGAGLLAGAALLTIFRNRSQPAAVERAHSGPPQ